MRQSTVKLICVLFPWLLAASSVHAAGPSRDDFTVLFEQGKSLLMAQDKPGEAYQAFRSAYALRPDPCLAIWIGRAAMEANQASDALIYLLDFKARCSRASQKAEEVEQRIAKLRGLPAPTSSLKPPPAVPGNSVGAPSQQGAPLPTEPARPTSVVSDMGAEVLPVKVAAPSADAVKVTPVESKKAPGAPTRQGPPPGAAQATEDAVIGACNRGDREAARRLCAALPFGEGAYAVFYCKKLGITLRLSEEDTEYARRLAAATSMREKEAALVRIRAAAQRIPEETVRHRWLGERERAIESSSEVLAEAKGLVQRDPTRALKLAETLIDVNCNVGEAWSVVGQASCQLKDKQRFFEAYQRAGVDQRRELIRACPALSGR